MSIEQARYWSRVTVAALGLFVLGNGPASDSVACENAIEQAELLYSGRRIVAEQEMPTALHCAARAFEFHDKLAGAETLLSRAVEESTTLGDQILLEHSLDLLGRFYARQGREADVLAVWDQNVALSASGKTRRPLGLTDVMLEMAEDRYGHAEYQQAMAFAGRVVKANGDAMFGNPALDATWLPDLYERLGQIEFAEHIHQMRIQKAPSTPVRKNALRTYSEFLVRHGRQAEAEAARLHAQRTKNESTENSTSDARLKNGAQDQRPSAPDERER